MTFNQRCFSNDIWFVDWPKYLLFVWTAHPLTNSKHFSCLRTPFVARFPDPLKRKKVSLRGTWKGMSNQLWVMLAARRRRRAAVEPERETLLIFTRGKINKRPLASRHSMISVPCTLLMGRSRGWNQTKHHMRKVPTKLKCYIFPTNKMRISVLMNIELQTNRY